MRLVRCGKCLLSTASVLFGPDWWASLQVYQVEELVLSTLNSEPMSSKVVLEIENRGIPVRDSGFG
jgi:hypothetical protein